MGYTHYWGYRSEPINQAEWAGIRADVEKLIAASPVTLWREYDEPDTKPVVDGEQVLFNGAGDDGHETFLLARSSSSDFEFCKTAEKPYDLVVCACLAVAAPYLSGVSSDGDLDDEWREPLAWASKVLGREVTLTFGRH